MRFGEELWCAPAHAALLRLQETELHLMESMKRWMAQRARSERDFSVQLHQMAAMLERQSRPPAADYISQLHKVRSILLSNIILDKVIKYIISSLWSPKYFGTLHLVLGFYKLN